MVGKDNLYLEILSWMYDKGSTGFTREELNTRFNLPGTKEANWISSLFFWGTPDNPPMIKKIYQIDSNEYFALSQKGISEAIDYLELKEARESSRDAKKIAICSIWIAIGVGILQIIIGIIELLKD